MTKIFSQKQQTSFRKQLRNSMTKSEVVLWKHIKGSQLGFKFRRQCGVSKYVVDFYCPELKLVVEVDGLTHYEEAVFNKDQTRDKYFASLGLVVKRYNASRVFNFLQEVLDDLYNTCNNLKSNHPPAPSFVRRGK
jgi:very-short-patch-repair endonuclease